jgi:hypothetical protein
MLQGLIPVSDYYSECERQISDEILREKDDRILFTDIEELVDYYCAEKCLTPIEHESNEQTSCEHIKKVGVVQAQDREPLYRHLGDTDWEFQHLHVTVPIRENKDIETIFKLIPSTFTLNDNPRVKVSSHALEFDVPVEGYGYHPDDENIASGMKSRLSYLNGWIERVNKDIARQNPQLKETTRRLIESRRAKLREDKQRILALAQKINIPLRQRQSAAATRIRLDPKPIIRRVKPEPVLPEEYVLDHSKVLDIVSFIDDTARQFERTPGSFATQREEVLRDFIMAGLNSLFVGKVTAETFSHNGKTDIYLCIEKGNILVCECKFWDGSKLYDGTIDQLRSYLTWHENFGIIITFVRQKSFSKVLDSIPGIVQGHKSYRSGFRKQSEHHFVSCHSHESDEQKQVEVHHLFYNLFTEH